MFSPGYSRPKADIEQSLFDVRTIYEHGKVFANFSRYLVSNDGSDISIDQCVYFLYPISGGKLDTETKEIRKHAESPIPSSKKICPISCAHAAATAKKVPQNELLLKASILPEESIVPQSMAYDVVLRILNRDWNPLLASRNTKEFQQMAAEVISAEKKATSTILQVNAMIKAKFPLTRVIEIKKFSKGSVLAFLTLLSEDSAPPTESDVKDFLNEQGMLRAPESLHLQATAVTFRQAEKVLSMKADQIRNWIIFGVGASLLLIATFLVCCTISRSRKARCNRFSSYQSNYPVNGYGYNVNRKCQSQMLFTQTSC
ncbi:unnamed protein product [Gongylonema pulchrum]|uniref:DOMON domain-containing protein n=1 Tax=Gongylonema pulchrum TaxID=637853 RepID=A0A183CY24_9BILA|nr:unnamed protein product [Gongylonema pulchrum]